MRPLVLLAVVAVAVTALPAHMPDPGSLAHILGEEEFEDYLDAWLAIEEPKWGNATKAAPRSSGCTFVVNGDLGQPQPVFLRGDEYLKSADNAGNILLDAGEEIRVACTGNNRRIRHSNIASTVSVATASCVNNDLVYGEGWLSEASAFGGLTCSSHPTHAAQDTGETCYNGNTVIRVGFTVENVFYPWYHTCFDRERLEVLYAWYPQTPENTVHQTNVDRPSWLAAGFFTGHSINNLYTQSRQTTNIGRIVGASRASEYVNGNNYLARGHLAAKSDFVFATGQRSTFYFINSAPQWQPINAGNWNWLEQNLRARIGAAGYNTMVYTGTYGVSQLRDAAGVPQDIYLTQTGSTDQLPVPEYYYKVAYDEGRRLATAFVTVNNIYYTEVEVRNRQFCTDHCRNNEAFEWLRWQPDSINYGYSFCCSLDEFQAFIPHLPHLEADGLLV